jgi:hypothetical protein
VVVATLLVAASLAGQGGGVAPAAAGGPPGIQGVVRSSGAGPVVPDAMVAALRPSDHSVVATTVADGSGAYELAGLVAGSYELYVVDPGGGHRAGFGVSGTVSVGASWTTRDLELAPSRGAIAGTVSSAGGGPVAGAVVLALSAVDGNLVAGTAADEDGAYVLDGLPVRDALLAFFDPTGGHVAEYHEDAGIAGADRVLVVAGEQQAVHAELAERTAVSTDASLQGTITEDGSGDPVPGLVVVLDGATLQPEGAAWADQDGTWSLPVDAGTHRVITMDPTAAHASEWHPNLPYHAIGSSGTVAVATGGSATVDAALAPTRGSVHGIVREDGSGDPIPGAWAVVIGPDGARAAVADGQGQYRIDDVPAGQQRATVVGPAGAHLQEYWDGGAGFADADAFSLAGGEDRALDVSLAVVPCPSPVPSAATRCTVAAPTAPGPAWATWTIPTGGHSANAPVHGAQAPATLTGFVNPGRLARRYQFVFDGSARYVLTNPTQPEDQLDWNKLPGLSDCGTFDLADDGWMFAWRWRTDLTPRVLEINAYANNDGTHLWLDQPLLTLTSAQLDARLPLWFDMRVSADRTRYEFTVRGPGSRVATGTLPRSCTTSSPTFQWAGGFYFGGTSTAPSTITGLMRELPT